MNPNSCSVVSLSKRPTHQVSKTVVDSLVLIKGQGVEGDAHCGETVKHRSRVAKNPDQPNLRQVHLMHKELFEELGKKGFSIGPGEMGENITTSGLDLLSLPKDTILKIGDTAEIQLTGLRNPCHQLNGLQEGLMQALLDRKSDGQLIRKAGVMAIVIKGGRIEVNDSIEVILPIGKPQPLERV